MKADNGKNIGSVEKTFRQRVSESCALFEEKEGQLRSYIDSGSREEMIGLASEILFPALKAAFELGFNGKKYELILSPEGNVTEMFVLDYYRRNFPESIKDRWNVLVGRQPNPNIVLRIGGIDVTAGDVEMWAEYGDKKAGLEFYCEKLLPVLREDENAAYNIAYILLDSTVGELAGMWYISGIKLLDERKNEAAATLSELPEGLWERYGKPEGGVFTPGIFYDSYTGYEPKNTDRESRGFDRSDVFIGVTCCAPLIYDYLCGDTRQADRLMSMGIHAGYLAYPNDIFDNAEERGKTVLDFRDRIQDEILKRAGEDRVLFTGGASGVFCSYIDFIAWDIGGLLKAAGEVICKSPLDTAFCRGMEKGAQPVRLK